MSIELRPYINFPGTTREAMEYYHGIFGGDLQVMTFGEARALPDDSPSLDFVMNAELRTAHFTLMASDIIEETPFDVKQGNDVNLALVASGTEALDALAKAFALFAEDPGTTIEMPLGRAMWGAVYGSLRDRYGRGWMFNIDVAEGQAGEFERTLM